jgi:predicted RNase H-like nuclease (RuvC/YqgF family)
VHNEIQEVSDDYKGIINFDDDEMLNKIKEKHEKREEGIKEETDKDVIKRLKKENIDILREVSHLKIQNQELEIENQKYIRKEQMLRDNITEMKISFEEMQHRFETRISEYKQQLHLRDERLNSLKDNIRFQRKMISEQDQAIAIAESMEGMIYK